MSAKDSGWSVGPPQPAIVIQGDRYEVLPIDRKHGGWWHCMLPVELKGRFIDKVIFVRASQSVSLIAGPMAVAQGQQLMFRGRGWR
jgi:hypothetical protein